MGVCYNHGHQENGCNEGNFEPFSHGACLLTSSSTSLTLSASTAPPIFFRSRTVRPRWNARIEEPLQKTSIVFSSIPPPSSILISGRAARSHSTKRSSDAAHVSAWVLRLVDRMQSI